MCCVVFVVLLLFHATHRMTHLPSLKTNETRVKIDTARVSKLVTSDNSNTIISLSMLCISLHMILSHIFTNIHASQVYVRCWKLSYEWTFLAIRDISHHNFGNSTYMRPICSVSLNLFIVPLVFNSIPPHAKQAPLRSSMLFFHIFNRR